MSSFDDLLRRYFDEGLTESERNEFQSQLADSSTAMERFVEEALLHDRLGTLVRAEAMLSGDAPFAAPVIPPAKVIRIRPASWLKATAAAIVAAVVTLMVFFWNGNHSAMAGHAELHRVIAASELDVDHTYAITVESSTLASNSKGRSKNRTMPEDKRPPKPPLDDAMLHVRGRNLFVLMRTTSEGNPFITGCDGRSSWAVPPHGPVRMSNDLQRFNHDVPGHEFSLSLCNLPDMLQQLETAFELSVLPVEYGDDKNVQASPGRLLIATKKRGYPGPRRVEIGYSSDTGEIDQLRFIDMPYGPDRLTVSLSRIESDPLPADFFNHSSHHSSDRRVESE